MTFANYLTKIKEAGQVAESAWKQTVDILILLMAPTVPHLAEELWQRTGHDYSIHDKSWPRWDETLAKMKRLP